MRAKIHHATVTDADLHYPGSITLDPRLMRAAGLLPAEQVDVLNMANGKRLTTYVIEGRKRGSGEVCLNGPAARYCRRGDLVLVVAYAQLCEEELRGFRSTTVWVDGRNKPVRIVRKRIWKRF